MRISTLFLMVALLVVGKLYEWTKFGIFENLALKISKPLAERLIVFVNDKIEN
jgi:hypothetical protein